MVEEADVDAAKITRGVPRLEELLNLTSPPLPTTDCCYCCPICLDSVSLRGGRPLYAPGCCGACMMHLECAFALPAADVLGRGGKCPLCRATIQLPRRSREAAAPPPPPKPLAGLAARQTVAFQLPPPVPYAAGSSSSNEDADESDESDGGDVEYHVFDGMVEFIHMAQQRQRQQQNAAATEQQHEGDIRLVMDQAHCTREAAIAAIRNNNGDLVNAIMELTI